MKYRTRSVVVDAITFDELVAYGRANTANIVNGMPWSFDYNGSPISHENDQCYLIPTPTGIHLRFTPDDMLITRANGSMYLSNKDVFEAVYELAALTLLSRQTMNDMNNDALVCTCHNIGRPTVCRVHTPLPTQKLINGGVTYIWTGNAWAQEIRPPDTEDTAALDDLLDDWNAAQIAFGQSCSATNEHRVNKARAAIHAHITALVQAERERCRNIAAVVADEMMASDGIGGRTDVACRILQAIQSHA